MNIMPEQVAPAVRPLLPVRGSLWVPAQKPYVLRLKTETLSRIRIDLLDATDPKKRKRRSSWSWMLEDGRAEHNGIVYSRWQANALRYGSLHVDADLLERCYAAKEISQKSMF